MAKAIEDAFQTQLGDAAETLGCPPFRILWGSPPFRILWGSSRGSETQIPSNERGLDYRSGEYLPYCRWQAHASEMQLGWVWCVCDITSC